MKKLLAFIVIVGTFFFPYHAFALVSLDATANATGDDVTAGWNHTVGAGANLLIVGVSNAAGSTGYSCTFNSVAMTKIGADRSDGATAISMFYLRNPSVGTYAVSCTGDAGNDGGVSASYKGLPSNFDIIGSVGCNTGGGACASLNVTTTFSNSLVVGVFGDTTSQSAGANTTERVEDTHGGGSFVAIADMGTFSNTPATYTITETSANVSQATSFGIIGGGDSIMLASMSF